MLIKEVIVGMISVLEDKSMQVREDTVVLEDGIEISRTYMRYVLAPGDEIDTKPPLVKDIANLVWTPEVIASYKILLQERMSKIPLSLPPNKEE